MLPMLRALMICVLFTSALASVCWADDSTEKLINELPKVSEPGIGYSQFFSGSVFLPYEDSEHLGTFIIGATQRTKSETLRKIVAQGADAVPTLLKHLADDRKINMKPLSGMMWMDFPDEYDFNRRTRKTPPQGVNREHSVDRREHPRQHAVTVGDLCFVALGQIVNRNYRAARYQPTAGLVVNSPTYSKRLREQIEKDWTDLTAEKHRKSLVDDFVNADYEGRRVGAYLRLSYYYPDAVEALVLAELQTPTFDSSRVHEFVADILYKTADVAERRKLYDQFIREHGPQYAAGIEEQLFRDLDLLEADEDDRLFPKLTQFREQPRELLIQLFAKPANIKSTDQTPASVASQSERASLIRALTHDKSRKIGDEVKNQFLANRTDAYFASACLACLANRGYAEFLIQQLDEIDLSQSEPNALHLEFLQAISTSKEAPVQERLLQIIQTTVNEAYFIAAVSGLRNADEKVILQHAKRILFQLPGETDQGRRILELVAERYPGQAKAVLTTFLSQDSPQRAKNVCIALHGHPLAKEILVPLLDDKRELKGYSKTMRVCDRAAEALSHEAKVKFDSDWPLSDRDAVIADIKAYYEAPTGKRE